MAQGHWRDEHGADYDVPAIVLNTLVDISWKNDVCPSFLRPLDAASNVEDPLRLWVDHPDADQREHAGASRFMVCAGCGDDPIYAGNDVAAALAALDTTRHDDGSYADDPHCTCNTCMVAIQSDADGID